MDADRNAIVPRAPAGQWTLISIIILLAAAFRLVGLNWDQGLFLHPDERNIISAASALHYPGSLIPHFHAYNGLAVYVPRVLAELGAWLAPGRLSAAPGEIALAGRLFSAVCSLAAVPVMFKAAQGAGLKSSAWFAALVMACAPGAIQAAHFGTTESLLVLMVALLAWLSTAHAAWSERPIARSLLYGLVLGLGLGFKTTAAAFGMIIFFAYAININRSSFWRTVYELCLAGSLAMVLFVITTPQILFDTNSYLSTMAFEGRVVSGAADVFWTYQFYGKIPGLFQFSQMPWVFGPIAAVMFLPGLLHLTVAASRHETSSMKLAPLVVTSCIYAAIIMTWHAKFIRYLLPLLPCVALLATVMFARLRVRHQWLATGLLCAGLLLPGLRQAQLYLQPDPRIAAWSWLAPQIRKNETILMEPREIGAPFAEPAAQPYNVKDLPLIDPSSPDKIESIIDMLAVGDWMIINSRRHTHVLPGMRQRFPEMCNYYKTLFDGGFGYELAGSFRRDQMGLFKLVDPSFMAEETYSVFDAPTVLIFRNARHLPRADISSKLKDGSCPDGVGAAAP